MNDTNHLDFAFSKSASLLLLGVARGTKWQTHPLMPSKIASSNCDVTFDLQRNTVFATITGHKDYQSRIKSELSNYSEPDAEVSARLIGSHVGAITDRRLGWRDMNQGSYLRVLHDGGAIYLHHCDEGEDDNTSIGRSTGSVSRVDPQGFIPWEPTVRVTTTNARFTAMLRKFRKKETFCVAANESAISIFSSGDEEPIRSFAASESHDSLTVAGAPYSIIYDTLYSRKSESLGLTNRLTNMGLSFDLTEYGIIKGRIYVTVSMGTASATLLFEGITPSKIDIPELPSTPRQRRGASTDSMNKTVLEKNWNEAEQQIIQQWRLAHQEECDSKNKPYSDSIQRWFSDYTMMLIRSGDSPSEMDLDIMSRL